jgi:hypothetical protein
LLVQSFLVLLRDRFGGFGCFGLWLGAYHG